MVIVVPAQAGQAFMEKGVLHKTEVGQPVPYVYEGHSEMSGSQSGAAQLANRLQTNAPRHTVMDGDTKCGLLFVVRGQRHKPTCIDRGKHGEDPTPSQAR
jgi:hypothetical protein